MKIFLAAIVASAIVSLVVLGLLGPKLPVTPMAPQQTAFQRVTLSHTLRCAYASYDPFITVGADGSITGIFHDVLEEAGKRLSLKVEWTEEVGYGNINAGFVTGRYDAFCAGLWPAGSRAASTIFSRPVVWDPVSVWVRGDDHRFDSGLATLNDPAYKIADIEGDATDSMADALYPKAGRQMVSQNQTIAEELMQVTTSKADALFQDYITADSFLKHTPGSLKDLSPGKPPLIYPLTVGFDLHETELKGMLDVVLYDMERDGTIAQIVKSHLGDKSSLLFVKQEDFSPINNHRRR